MAVLLICVCEMQSIRLHLRVIATARCHIPPITAIVVQGLRMIEIADLILKRPELKGRLLAWSQFRAFAHALPPLPVGVPPPSGCAIPASSDTRACSFASSASAA